MIPFIGIQARYYYTCCRDGKYRENTKPRQTSKKRPLQKDSRKMDDTCISKMYVDEYLDGHVEVKYIPAHTGHELGSCEIKQLPLPESTKGAVAVKLSLGIPPARILDGKLSLDGTVQPTNPSIFPILYMDIDIREMVGNRQNRDNFDQCVSRKHFLTKRDINNVRVKVNDALIKRHENDATSVTMMVAELKEEPFNPILIFKPQGIQDPAYPTLQMESFVLVLQTKFQMELFRKHASTILCIDSTHGTNQYRFKLITCIVPDDHGKGEDHVSALKKYC